MEISNIRKEFKDSKVYLIADIQCNFSKNKQLWFNVDKYYEDWLTDDVYDAFLVETIYMAMFYNENIEIRGNISKKIYRNLTDYIIPVINSLNPDFKIIKIKANGFSNCIKTDANLIGTGFSGGVDSFSTIIDKYEIETDPEYRINTLFFFNIGQYQGRSHQTRLTKALQFYNNSLEFAREINLPYIFMDSNMFDFYLPHWEYDAGPLCRIASILVFQRAISRYYISGSNHYLQQNSSTEKHLDDVTDEFIYSMLSPDGIDIILDGNQYFRSQKVEKLVNYEYAKKHLNVCVNGNINVQVDKNCSICHKCLRTLIILESLGKLNDFSHVFHLDKYSSVSYINKCWISLQDGKGAYATENAAFARKHGIRLPSKVIAWLYLFPSRFKSKFFH